MAYATYVGCDEENNTKTFNRNHHNTVPSMSGQVEAALCN